MHWRRRGMSLVEGIASAAVIGIASAAVAGSVVEYNRYREDTSTARMLRQIVLDSTNHILANEATFSANSQVQNGITIPIVSSGSGGGTSSGGGLIPPITFGMPWQGQGQGHGHGQNQSGGGGGSASPVLVTPSGHRPEVSVRIAGGSRQAHVAVALRDGPRLSERRMRRIAARAHPDAAVVVEASSGQLMARFIDGRLRPLSEILPNASSVSASSIVGRVVVPSYVPIRTVLAEGIHRPNLGAQQAARAQDNILMQNNDVRGPSRVQAATVNTQTLRLGEIATAGAACSENRRLARTSGNPPVLLVCHNGVWVSQRTGV